MEFILAFLRFPFGKETGIYKRCLLAGVHFCRFLDSTEQAFWQRVGRGAFVFLLVCLCWHSGLQMSVAPRLGSWRRQKNNSLELTAGLFLESRYP